MTAQRPQIPARPPPRLKWVWFDPTRLLTLLARVFAPIRQVGFLMWPAIALALLIVVHDWRLLLVSQTRHFSGFNFIFHMLLGLMTNNLVSKLTQGAVIVYQGGRVDEFGIRLNFRVYPRFYIPVGSVRMLPFRAQRACYAAPLKARLVVIVGGIMLWAMLRRSNAGAADAALILSTMAVVGFLISVNPFWRSNGYRWITAYFEQPRLREDGLRILRLAFTGQPIPTTLGRARMWALAVYAALSVVFMVGLVLLVLAILAYVLEQRFSGTGVVLFSIILALVVHSVLRFVSFWRARKVGRKGATGFEAGSRTATDFDRPVPPRSGGRPREPYGRGVRR